MCVLGGGGDVFLLNKSGILFLFPCSSIFIFIYRLFMVFDEMLKGSFKKDLAVLWFCKFWQVRKNSRF